MDHAIIMNRGLQEGVKAYKNILLKRKKKRGGGGEGGSPMDQSSTLITHSNTTNEAPIQKRMPSRNYSTMTVAKLQQIYRELQLPTIGDQKTLIQRLRTFQCMWNAELDSIDPKTPSQLVTELKHKERLEREEKSKEILSGSAQHTRYLKTVKEGNIHNDTTNKDLGSGITKIMSGNMKFDQKMNMNFTTMIAQVRARQQMEKQKNTTIVVKDSMTSLSLTVLSNAAKRNREIVKKNDDVFEVIGEGGWMVGNHLDQDTTSDSDAGNTNNHYSPTDNNNNNYEMNVRIGNNNTNNNNNGMGRILPPTPPPSMGSSIISSSSC